MAALAEAFVAVRADTKQFKGDVEKGVRGAGPDAEKAGKHVGTRFGVGLHGAIGSVVSRSAGIFAAGFAAFQGAKIFGGFIKDAAESARVSRITANAIKATGGAAKISADQVSFLATSISNKTAIDDEQIQTAANMLLTFKNIRNEAGKNNDIFNQATQAAADLSIQFGGMDNASKQLGKALNDPIKGTTALAKSGVTFTEQQKKQIKVLQESGDTLGAQKIILKEINEQVGGAAAAAADPMERLRVVAGNLGEDIGTLLLPTVTKLSNFISNEVIGGLRAFGSAFQANDGDVTSSGLPGFLERLGFAARQAFEYFKTSVLPRLKDFAGFIRDEVVPRLVQFGTYLRDTVMPIVARIVRDHLAKLKGVFDQVSTAMRDNRPQLVQIFHGLQDLARVLVEKVIPFLYRVGSVTLPLLGNAIKLGITIVGGLVTAFNAIKTPIQAALKFVWTAVSTFFGLIVTGAAKTFGWVPGLGPKLKTAAQDFETFKNAVNDSLDGIDDEAIKVALAYTAKGINLTAPSSVGRKAAGGAIHGPGTGTSDTAGLFRLSRGEHVVTAAEVSGAGGHGAIESMRARWRGMATGGRVGLNIQTALPSSAYVDAVAHATALQAGKDIASMTPALGAAGPPGRARGFRGVTLNERTIRMLLGAERMLGAAFRIMQGSYSTSVAASGGTHAGGGAMDTDGPRGWSTAVGALRRAGFAAWHRTPAQGPWGHHIHSIAIGDPTASPAAKRQVADFLRGGDGLGSSTRFGSRVQSFDRGGMLQPGWTMAHNGTGRPEAVGIGGVHFHNCTFAGTSKRDFEDLVVGAFDRAKGRGRI